MVKICEFLEILLNDFFGIVDNKRLSDDEVEFIETLRDNPDSFENIKRILNIK